MTLQLKKSLRLLPYTFNFKGSLLCIVLFIVLGLLFTLALPESMQLGVAYTALGPLMLMQMYISLLYAGSVKASPRSKVIEIYVSDLLSAVIQFVAFLYMLILCVIKSAMFPEDASSYAFQLFVAGLTLAAVTIYMSTAYKSFIASIIGFFIVIMAIYILVGYFEFKEPPSFTLLSGGIWGFVICVIGFFLSCFIRRLLYRKSLSRLAAGANLRKHL